MIIDLILDRKDNEKWHGEDLYCARDFYHEVCDYSGLAMGAFDYISIAMDYGTEADVRKALCRYIDDNEYNEKIKEYINSREWLD